MWAPVQGPANPNGDLYMADGTVKNLLTGHVENHDMSDAVFHEQFLSAQHSFAKSVPFSRERVKQGDAGDLDGFKGPWAEYVEEYELNQAEEDDEKLGAGGGLKRTREEVDAEQQDEESGDKQKAKKPMLKSQLETSTFHGDEMYDYQGRSYLHPPPSLKPRDHRCYIPKRCVHTWIGHTKPVNAIRFFPKYGHLLLSASMDAKVKLWDVYKERKAVRTFSGHSSGVRDIAFNHDGSRFISASYDRYLKLWDAETGECISRFTSGAVPFCVRIHPGIGRDHEFLVGQSNKKVVQWDARSGKIVQSYEEHLGSVSTVTFVDHGRRFVSTGDDKKMFVWEYGIPVVIKHISDPTMHSMPATAVHPDGRSVAVQSADNQVLVYTTGEKFKINKKKRFEGHQVAGYATSVCFSPDGQFLVSGDAMGKAVFWDWYKGKLLSRLDAHDQVTIGVAWHPIEPSKVATCSWDHTIKFWD
eukprot:TRINITY_DN10865_c0_g3_i1.p1 TRINITY_DN10865_c0_g3~~TRINITY_DN10865_c0_g3_i1.p1  ORF type:complete len:536 (+),score=133.59 TRINITY_DN10865_c0_g3_i1:197-1609(+)